MGEFERSKRRNIRWQKVATPRNMHQSILRAFSVILPSHHRTRRRSSKRRRKKVKMRLALESPMWTSASAFVSKLTGIVAFMSGLQRASSVVLERAQMIEYRVIYSSRRSLSLAWSVWESTPKPHRNAKRSYCNKTNKILKNAEKYVPQRRCPRSNYAPPSPASSPSH